MTDASNSLSFRERYIEPFLDDDGDGLSDADERKLKTNIQNWDSDGDTVPDRTEVRVLKSNPNDPDSDDDDVSDRTELVYGGPRAVLNPKIVARPPGAGPDWVDPILHNPNYDPDAPEVWDDPGSWENPMSLGPRPPQHMPETLPPPPPPVKSQKRASVDSPDESSIVATGGDMSADEYATAGAYSSAAPDSFAAAPPEFTEPSFEPAADEYAYADAGFDAGSSSDLAPDIDGFA